MKANLTCKQQTWEENQTCPSEAFFSQCINTRKQLSEVQLTQNQHKINKKDDSQETLTDVLLWKETRLLWLRAPPNTLVLLKVLMTHQPGSSFVLLRWLLLERKAGFPTKLLEKWASTLILRLQLTLHPTLVLIRHCRKHETLYSAPS